VKKIWEILSFFIIVSLAVPAGVFANSPAVFSPAGQAPVVTAQVVTVTAVKSQQTVVPQSSAASSCSFAAMASAGLTQNFGVINLNQPASCFSLVLAKAAALPSLTVTVAHPAAVVVVQNQNRISGAPLFVPKQAGQDTALPSLVFIVSVVLMFEERKSIQKTFNRLSKNIIQSLTLHQLGILRC
jgi:hypothetical protein